MVSIIFSTDRLTGTTIEPQSINVEDRSGDVEDVQRRSRIKTPMLNQPSMQSVSEISKVSLSSTFSKFPDEFDEGEANRRFFSFPLSFSDAALARP